MTPIKVILLSCGSFNPPTNMHLRMFEIARDHLHRLGNYVVIGGLVSPVHDSYGKKELVSSTHRMEMLKLALQNSDWIKLSDWECKQENWNRTKTSIQYHQNLVNAVLNNTNHDDIDGEVINWFPKHVINGFSGPIQIKLLCGGDLLESFGTPGLWADEDIDSIVGQHGLVVVTREGANPLKFIYESDVLTRHMNNIQIVTEWVTNEVSSTKIRRALRRSDSVKYLIPDCVIDYIHKHGLYGTKHIKYLNPMDSIVLNFLTPSPTDVSMESPSPSDSNCISICNNNLFPKIRSVSKPLLTYDTVDSTNKVNTFKHPGQAVKIFTNESGEHTVIKNEVRKYKSCAQLDEKKVKFKTSKSSSEIDDCHSCDESMIKFIFTKHGIQVISDIETVV